jgi:hypothetical protein
MGVIKDIGTSAKLEFFAKIRVKSKIFKIILDLGLKNSRLGLMSLYNLILENFTSSFSAKNLFLGIGGIGEIDRRRCQ